MALCALNLWRYHTGGNTAYLITIIYIAIVKNSIALCDRGAIALSHWWKPRFSYNIFLLDKERDFLGGLQPESLSILADVADCSILNVISYSKMSLSSW